MADKINWNIPTIKAARITGRGGGGGGGRGTANWGAVGQAISNVGNSIAAGIQLRKQQIEHEKQSQIALLKDRNKTTQLLYDKVAMIKDGKGSFKSDFEVSKNEYFYGLIDKYVEIKTAMDDPNSGIDLALGRRGLAEINSSVDKYKSFAPAMLTAASNLKESLNIQFGKSGAIAGGVPTAQQQLLLNLIEGGDVRIMDDRGNLILYDVNDKGDVQNVFNIDEYMAVTDQGADPDKYFRTIADMKPEYQDAAALVGTAEKPNSSYYDFESNLSTDGTQNIVDLTWKEDKNGIPIGKEAAIKNVAASGFNYMVEDPKEQQAMADLWNDTIGVDPKGMTGQDEPWDAKNQEKRKYKVKGFVDDQGVFNFDPDGDTSQVFKDVFGNELELTQAEFAKRWFAEEAIRTNAPTPAMVSRTKVADDKTGKGYSYDMYEGYHNTQKEIQEELKKGDDANLGALNIPIMREGSDKAWKFNPASNGKSAQWQHVKLGKTALPDGTIIPAWEPIKDDVIDANGSWSKMKQSTKQYRTKND